MLKVFRRNARGFTLIELLIVVAIIGILAAIAIPNLLSAQKRSKISRAASDTKQIVTQSQLYINDNNTVPSDITKLWDGTSPNGTVYMAQVKDPFKTTADYQYGKQGVTDDVAAWSVGPDQTSDTTYNVAGTTCGDDDISYSMIKGGCGF